MKKQIIHVLVLCIGMLCNAQSDKDLKKWYSTVELETVFVNKLEYNYGLGHTGHEDDIADNGFKLKSFGVQFAYNYLVFKNLSIGVLGGFQTLADPNLFMLKLGGVLKFYFVDRDNIYIYIQGTPLISLNKDQFKKGFGGRFGMGLPIYRNDNFNITTNIFAEMNQLDLKGAKPIYENGFEEPLDLIMRSWGISFGIQF